ncbi:MAG: protein kinase [Acidimicrobiales bacterium]|nr:protein kinase [Acidimicrobiales bacterium]
MDLSVPGYELLEEIDSGGPATVYRARDLRLGRIVALKVFTDAAWSDAVERRFARDRSALERLSAHPGVVTTYGVGRASDGSPVIATAYSDSDSLQDRLDGSGPNEPVGLDWRVATALILDAADTIEHAHSLGIFHRAIKPAHILIDASGQAVVSDFGVAQLVQDWSESVTLSAGSLGLFSPPEAFDGAPPTPPADVYSLGATLWAAIVGHPPLTVAGEAVSLMESMKRIAEVPVQDLGPRAPQAVSDVVRRAMAKRPEDRYPTARAFADALRAARAEAGVAIDQGPPTVVEAAPTVVESPPPAPAAELVAAPVAPVPPEAAAPVSPAAAAAAPTFSWDEPNQQTTAQRISLAERRNAQSRTLLIAAACLVGVLLVGTAVWGVFLRGGENGGGDTEVAGITEQNPDPDPTVAPTVVADGPPVVEIVPGDEIIQTNVDVPVELSFTSEGAIDRFEWDLGLFGQFSDIVITPSFPEPAEYVVFLGAEGPGGTGADSVIIQVLPAGAALGPDLFGESDQPRPVAGFDASTSSPVVGERVTFRNTSTNSSTFVWRFGLETSDLVDATFTFAEAGTFTVTLFAFGDGGVDSTTQTLIVTNNLLPIADFAVSSETPAPCDRVTFTNRSQKADRFRWELGNGETSTDINPTTVYNTAGEYIVALTAVNDEGEDTTTLLITVGDLTGDVAAASPPTPVC